MLVAVSIPIFTSQLEKSRESVDLSNVRAAYAEVMSAALTGTKKTENGITYAAATGWSKEVTLKQAQDGWQTDVASIEIGGIASGSWTGTPKANGKCTVSYTEAGGADFKWEYIPSTKVLIEQKGLGKDLNKPIKQSDGSFLTPFQQAKRYITELPLSKHPRWVITCNFEEFYIYDMERPGREPEKIRLADLKKEYYRFSFLTDTGSEHIKREMEISIKAGEVVGLLYDAFQKQYKNPDDPETLKSLNKLCVRLVFCLYAEDAGIFGKHMCIRNC